MYSSSLGPWDHLLTCSSCQWHTEAQRRATQLAGVKEGRLSFVGGLLGSWLKAGGQHCQFVYRKVKPREDC